MLATAVLSHCTLQYNAHNKVKMRWQTYKAYNKAKILEDTGRCLDVILTRCDTCLYIYSLQAGLEDLKKMLQQRDVQESLSSYIKVSSAVAELRTPPLLQKLVVGIQDSHLAHIYPELSPA